MLRKRNCNFLLPIGGDRRGNDKDVDRITDKQPETELDSIREKEKKKREKERRREREREGGGAGRQQ